MGAGGEVSVCGVSVTSLNFTFRPCHIHNCVENAEMSFIYSALTVQNYWRSARGGKVRPWHRDVERALNS